MNSNAIKVAWRKDVIKFALESVIIVASLNVGYEATDRVIEWHHSSQINQNDEDMDNN